MSLESVDFQALIHQTVSGLIEGWKQFGIPDDVIQEDASQCFNMGMIASSQLQKEGGIQPQGTEQLIPYTPEMATKVITCFVMGLNTSIIKSNEMKIPSREKWQIIQNVAFHVFEQSKQAVVATLGQENTPDVQITDQQIYEWLGNTAIEALMYYINEHEKAHGPLVKGEVEGGEMPDLLSEDAGYMQEEQPVAYEEPAMDEEPVPQEQAPQPVAQQAPQRPPDIHHKYAAVGLLLNTISQAKQQKILSAFNDEQKNVIMHYRDPDTVAAALDMSRVAQYLKAFKEKLGESTKFGKSRYGSTVSRMIQSVPKKRLLELFRNERPFVRGYIHQVLLANEGKETEMDLYDLPAGVEESLLLYLYRNFPQIADKMKQEEEEELLV